MAARLWLLSLALISCFSDISLAQDSLPESMRMPGEPGKDYPVLAAVPETTFSCIQQPFLGYYADVSTGCQVYHWCGEGGTQSTFLCPNGTIFNQMKSKCDEWFHVDCQLSPQLFWLNKYSPEEINVNTNPLQDEGGTVSSTRVIKAGNKEPEYENLAASDLNSNDIPDHSAEKINKLKESWKKEYLHELKQKLIDKKNSVVKRIEEIELIKDGRTKTIDENEISVRDRFRERMSSAEKIFLVLNLIEKLKESISNSKLENDNGLLHKRRLGIGEKLFKILSIFEKTQNYSSAKAKITRELLNKIKVETLRKSLDRSDLSGTFNDFNLFNQTYNGQINGSNDHFERIERGGLPSNEMTIDIIKRILDLSQRAHKNETEIGNINASSTLMGETNSLKKVQQSNEDIFGAENGVFLYKNIQNILKEKDAENASEIWNLRYNKNTEILNSTDNHNNDGNNPNISNKTENIREREMNITMRHLTQELASTLNSTAIFRLEDYGQNEHMEEKRENTLGNAFAAGKFNMYQENGLTNTERNGSNGDFLEKNITLTSINNTMNDKNDVPLYSDHGNNQTNHTTINRNFEMLNETRRVISVASNIYQGNNYSTNYFSFGSKEINNSKNDFKLNLDETRINNENFDEGSEAKKNILINILNSNNSSDNANIRQINDSIDNFAINKSKENLDEHNSAIENILNFTPNHTSLHTEENVFQNPELVNILGKEKNKEIFEEISNAEKNMSSDNSTANILPQKNVALNGSLIDAKEYTFNSISFVDNSSDIKTNFQINEVNYVNGPSFKNTSTANELYLLNNGLQNSTFNYSQGYVSNFTPYSHFTNGTNLFQRDELHHTNVSSIYNTFNYGAASNTKYIHEGDAFINSNIGDSNYTLLSNVTPSEDNLIHIEERFNANASVWNSSLSHTNPASENNLLHIDEPVYNFSNTSGSSNDRNGLNFTPSSNEQLSLQNISDIDTLFESLKFIESSMDISVLKPDNKTLVNETITNIPEITYLAMNALFGINENVSSKFDKEKVNQVGFNQTTKNNLEMNLNEEEKADEKNSMENQSMYNYSTDFFDYDNSMYNRPQTSSEFSTSSEEMDEEVSEDLISILKEIYAGMEIE